MCFDLSSEHDYLTALQGPSTVLLSCLEVRCSKEKSSFWPEIKGLLYDYLVSLAQRWLSAMLIAPQEVMQAHQRAGFPWLMLPQS